MEELQIHQDVKKKLTIFIEEKKIPHIIFYGPSGCGKRNVLDFFIREIYKTTENIKKYVMYINGIDNITVNCYCIIRQKIYNMLLYLYNNIFIKRDT